MVGLLFGVVLRYSTPNHTNMVLFPWWTEKESTDLNAYNESLYYSQMSFATYREVNERIVRTQIQVKSYFC